MRRIAFVLVAAAFLPLVTDYGFASSRPDATLSVPASTSGGQLVIVSGTSPSGEAGTKILLSDDNGRIKPHSIVWQGSEFTVKFYAPDFDEDDPENEIEVAIKPTAPSHTVNEYIAIRA